MGLRENSAEGFCCATSSVLFPGMGSSQHPPSTFLQHKPHLSVLWHPNGSTHCPYATIGTGAVQVNASLLLCWAQGCKDQ